MHQVTNSEFCKHCFFTKGNPQSRLRLLALLLLRSTYSLTISSRFNLASFSSSKKLTHRDYSYFSMLTGNHCDTLGGNRKALEHQLTLPRPLVSSSSLRSMNDNCQGRSEITTPFNFVANSSKLEIPKQKDVALFSAIQDDDHQDDHKQEQQKQLLHQDQQIQTIEASASFSSIQTMEEEIDDAKWSIYSNVFFVTGGIFYIIATSWDYALFSSNRDVDIDLLLDLHQRILYELLWFMCPTVYLFNSFIDIKWALKVRRRDRRIKQLKEILMNDKKGQQDVEGMGSGRTEDFDRTTKNNETSSDVICNPSDSEAILYQNQSSKNKRRALHLRKLLLDPTQKLFRRMRKHVGHRRQLTAATTFGIAAALSVLGATCYLISTEGKFSFAFRTVRNIEIDIDSTELGSWAKSLEKSSIYMYLVSAIFALWRNPSNCTKSSRSRMRCSNSPCPSMSSNADSPSPHWSFILPMFQFFNDVESIETLGDVFFGVASVVDVILASSTLDDNVLWWPILSAWLWTLDALFYLRGDYVTLYLKDDGDIHSDNGISEDDGDVELEESDGCTELDCGVLMERKESQDIMNLTSSIV